MRTLIRFSIIVLFLVLGLQAVTAQTSPTRLRLKQLELAPDSTEHVITSDTNRVAVWTKVDSVLFGTVTGPLTSGRIPRATGTYTLGDGVLRDDGTLLALGGATVSGYSFYDYSTGAWRLATGTTAQRPTNIAGLLRYNTSLGYSETANGSTWLQSDFPVGATNYTIRHDGTSWVSNSLLQSNASSLVWIKNATPPPNSQTFGVAGSSIFGAVEGDYLQIGGGGAIGATFNSGNTNGAGRFTTGGGWLTYSGSALSFSTSARFNGTSLYLRFGTSQRLQSANARIGAIISEINSSTGPRIFQWNFAESIIPDINGNTTSFYVGLPSRFQRTSLINNSAQVLGALFRQTITADTSSISPVTLIGMGIEPTFNANGLTNIIRYGIRYRASTTGTHYAATFNSGLVGIGTETPAQTLHVAGTMRLTGSDGTATALMGRDADGDISAVTEGYGINVTGGALEVDTTQIATQSDLASVAVTTLYTADGTIATDRTVTIGSDKTLTISGTTPDLPGYSFTEKKGYNSDWDTWGNYRLIYTDDYFTNFIQGILNYDSTVFVRLSAGDWVGDHFVSMQMDEAGNLSLSGFDDSGTSAGLNLSDNATVGGYGARLQGGAGIEFDTDTGGKFVYQVNNTTEAQLDATGLGLSGSTPAFTLDMENATDAIDMPGGTTAQRPTNESELLRYNSDNARMEYADGTNWRDLLPATGTTGAAILPSGTTAQRDGSPANGYIRYNSTIGELEAYVQSAWATVQASPRSYADMVGSGAATYIESGTPEVIDTVTNIVAVGFTHSAGVLTYTGTTNKNFLVTISAVVGEADTDAATAVLRLYQNSSIKGVSQMYCALHDEKYSMNISRIVTLATNDTLDCRLASAGEWIVSNFYFNVTPID